MEHAHRAQVEHDFRDAAGEEDANRGMMLGAVGECVDEPRDLLVHCDPIVDGGAAQTGRVRNRGNVEQQVGRSAERGVHDHGVGDGRIGQQIAAGEASFFKRKQRRGGTPGHVDPHGLAGRSEGGVR